MDPVDTTVTGHANGGLKETSFQRNYSWQNSAFDSIHVDLNLCYLTNPINKARHMRQEVEMKAFHQ